MCRKEEFIFKEVWKNIKGYEGLYQVSNLGRVRSFPRKGTHSNNIHILSPGIDHKGYLNVRLSKRCKGHSFRVHKLVAMAFIPNTHNKEQINHINGIKTDNRVTNLEWCTNLENMRHSWNIGLRSKDKTYHYGKDNVLSVAVEQYSLNGKFIRKWYCIKDIERALGFDNRNICACCRGKRPTAYGYKWRYA